MRVPDDGRSALSASQQDVRSFGTVTNGIHQRVIPRLQVNVVPISQTAKNYLAGNMACKVFLLTLMSQYTSGILISLP